MTRFYNLLNQNGKVYLGFGPLYNFYNGDHGWTKSYLPWFHLIIPEKLNIKRHNLKNKRKINKIEDLGLSKYSYKQYVNLFKIQNSKFPILKINLSDHPIAFIFNILRKIKFLSEFFTFNIYCIFSKINLRIFIYFKYPNKCSCSISTLPNCLDLALPFFVYLEVFFFSICRPSSMNFC